MYLSIGVSSCRRYSESMARAAIPAFTMERGTMLLRAGPDASGVRSAAAVVARNAGASRVCRDRARSHELNYSLQHSTERGTQFAITGTCCVIATRKAANNSQQQQMRSFCAVAQFAASRVFVQCHCERSGARRGGTL